MSDSIGKYQLHELLGQGGFGLVYRATDTTLDRVVALKVLHPQLLVDPELVARFKKEARIIAQLDHPNVVTIYEVGEAGGHQFIAMKYLPGGSLKTRIQSGSLSFEEALPILRDACAGLQHAHQKGLIHRDLKPANILFDADGRAVVTDFGLAKALSASSSALSSAQGGVGTPFYRAPEIWKGEPPASPATDVYSLGCILYEMLTGQVLFDGPTPDVVMFHHFIEGPKIPEDWQPKGAPAGLKDVMLKALAKDSSDRYSNAEAFWLAVENASHAGAAAQQKEEEARRQQEQFEQWRREADAKARALLLAEQERARQAAEEKARLAREEEARRKAQGGNETTGSATTVAGGKQSTKKGFPCLTVGLVAGFGMLLFVLTLIALQNLGWLSPASPPASEQVRPQEATIALTPTRAPAAYLDPTEAPTATEAPAAAPVDMSGYQFSSPKPGGTVDILSDGTYLLRVPDGGRDMDPGVNMNGISVFKQLGGVDNFDMVVDVSADIAESNYEAAGLMFKINQGNLIYVALATPGVCATEFRNFQKVTDHNDAACIYTSPKPNHALLVLSRRGNLITASAMLPDNNINDWKLLYSTELTGDLSQVTAGLFLLNNWHDLPFSAKILPIQMP